MHGRSNDLQPGWTNVFWLEGDLTRSSGSVSTQSYWRFNYDNVAKLKAVGVAPETAFRFLFFYGFTVKSQNEINEITKYCIQLIKLSKSLLDKEFREIVFFCCKNRPVL